jgi:hypothetical protein
LAEQAWIPEKEDDSMKRDSGARIDWAADLILIAGAVLIVSAVVPGFKVSGLQGLVNTTEKLRTDWEGKVAVVTGGVMVVAGALMLLRQDRRTRLLLSGLAAISALVALGSGSYAISVFHSKTVEAVAAELSAKQGVPLAQAIVLVKTAANKGLLQMSGKIGIYLLIVSASVGFLVAAFAMAKAKRSTERPAMMPPSAVAENPTTGMGADSTAT